MVGRSRALDAQQLRMENNIISDANGKILVSYKTTGEQLAELPNEITEAVQEQANEWLRRGTQIGNAAEHM